MLIKRENVDVIYENWELIFVYSWDFRYFSLSNVSSNSFGKFGSRAFKLNVLTMKESKYSKSCKNNM